MIEDIFEEYGDRERVEPVLGEARATDWLLEWASGPGHFFPAWRIFSTFHLKLNREFLSSISLFLFGGLLSVFGSFCKIVPIA